MIAFFGISFSFAKLAPIMNGQNRIPSVQVSDTTKVDKCATADKKNKIRNLGIYERDIM